MAEVVVELARFRSDLRQFAKREPLAGEVVDEGVRFRIGQHAQDLFPIRFGIGQLSLDRRPAQFVVRNRAPEEKGQARRQLEVPHRVDLPGGDLGGFGFETEEELR